MNIKCKYCIFIKFPGQWFQASTSHITKRFDEIILDKRGVQLCLSICYIYRKKDQRLNNSGRSVPILKKKKKSTNIHKCSVATGEQRQGHMEWAFIAWLIIFQTTRLPQTLKINSTVQNSTPFLFFFSFLFFFAINRNLIRWWMERN